MSIQRSMSYGRREEARDRLFLCAICRQPIDLKTSKTDSEGEAVHEDCYVHKMLLRSVNWKRSGRSA
jgi:hypothetical protein